jgi:hypothetical protein
MPFLDSFFRDFCARPFDLRALCLFWIFFSGNFAQGSLICVLYTFTGFFFQGFLRKAL